MSVGLCTRVKSWGEEGNSLKKDSLCWLMREKKGCLNRLEEVIWWKDQKERDSGGGRRTSKSLAGAGKCKHTAQGILILVRLCHAREGAREEVTLI